MFGRKQQPEEVPVVTSLGHEEYQEPYDEGFVADDGADHWDVLPSHLQRPDGCNYFIRNRPGPRQYYSHVEYLRALGVSEAQLAAEAGYAEDPLLQEMRDLSHAKLGNRPSGPESKEDDRFSIKIAKIEGLEISGNGSLARLLQGDPQPAAPSIVEQYLAQRLAEGGMPAHSPYIPNDSYAPQYPYAGPHYPELTPYSEPHDEDGNIIDGTVLDHDEEPQSAAWATEQTPSEAHVDEWIRQDTAEPEPEIPPVVASVVPQTEVARSDRKKKFTARRVGALVLCGGLMTGAAYSSFALLSWVPFYGPHHTLHKADIISDLNATMNATFNPNGNGK